MNYIIYDLEWNQPPDKTATIVDPVCLEGEIIEIGAVKLDERFRAVDELRLFVMPQYYRKMHKRIASLTGIHDQDLEEKGIPFTEAYSQFARWCGKEYALMSWSMSDLPILIDNMIIHGIDISDLPEFYDIQRIFSREIMHGETRYSLETALTILKEKGDCAHDALHDARNAAKVCSHLDLDLYLEEYTSKVFAEIPDGTIYETRRKLLEAPAAREFVCPWCGKSVTCEPWVRSDGGVYFGYGLCPEEDEFLVQMSMGRAREGGWYAERFLFEMSDDLWDIYMDKKEGLGV